MFYNFETSYLDKVSGCMCMCAGVCAKQRPKTRTGGKLDPEKGFVTINQILIFE